MSRMNPQDYVILNDRKFEELCAIVGVKQLCCLDPDRKMIEKAFRKKALKCHPDKGGDAVVFKKLNDAYLKLIGHIHKVIICLWKGYKTMKMWKQLFFVVIKNCPLF